MEFKEAVKIALQSLWANKLRSILTLLGVVIGVTSVIAVVTLVNGANTYVTTKFASYGADVFTVSKMPQSSPVLKNTSAIKSEKTSCFPTSLYQANCQRCAASAHSRRRGKDCARNPVRNRHQIRGYTWQMPSLQNLNIEQGRGFTAGDEEHASPSRSLEQTYRTIYFPASIR